MTDHVRCPEPRHINPEEQCRGTTVPGRQACFAHLPAKSRANALDEVGHGITLTNLDIDSELIGTLKHYPGRWEANFRGAVFTEAASFSGTDFIGDVDFGEAIFMGSADFGGVTFPLVADFAGAQFCRKAVFSQATFAGDLRLGGVAFGGSADFGGTHFKADATFLGASFSDFGNFMARVFAGDALFVGATFIVIGLATVLRWRTSRYVANPAAAGWGGLHFNRFWDCVAISARSTVSFLSPVTDGLTAGGTLLFLARKLPDLCSLASPPSHYEHACRDSRANGTGLSFVATAIGDAHNPDVRRRLISRTSSPTSYSSDGGNNGGPAAGHPRSDQPPSSKRQVSCPSHRSE